ncbi:MarR family transcriptional regulator [Romboutsia weinsteinii]|uniref:MarR family transcriptional regulator n=1 Tax=Romboutsia weinsteinii TaxID=2020949 RepID=A0A371IXY9_9FIRM|nr:MarR family transcriptional regulator [Romboutsia weinsteinii]RDY25340.1 MarR family transcriptional regulator [Romboutsia weinsteinii]
MKTKREETNNKTLHSALIRVIKAHRKNAHTQFSKISLTEGKPKILDFLENNPGCSQRELATYCRIEPATATSILAGMEKEDLIFRERNIKDKRILNVFLTEKGKNAQKKVEKVFTELDNKCFDGFSEEEKNQTIHILNRLYDNLMKGEGDID